MRVAARNGASVYARHLGEAMDALLPYGLMVHKNAWASYRLLRSCIHLKLAGLTVARSSFVETMRCRLRTAAPLILASAVFISISPCFASTAEDQHAHLHDPRAVLADALKATGGAAWDSIHHLRVHFNVAAGGRSGTGETTEDLETGRFVTIETVGPTTTADGYDGTSVWTEARSRAAYILGDEDARLTAVNESYRTARAFWFDQRRAAAIEYKGLETENARTFDVLIIAPEGGRPFDLWIDHGSHLVDRWIEHGAERDSTVRLSDYREQAGVKIPFKMEMGSAVRTVTSVDVDGPLDQAQFNLPPAQTGLAGVIAPAPVTVPFRLVGDDIVLSMSINGKGPFDCEFDSGGNLVVPPAVVSKLGLSSEGQQRGYGGGEGFVTSGRGVAESISFGGATLGRQAFSSFNFRDDLPERVLAGSEVLQNYVVSINFDKMQITLTPPAQYRYAGAGQVVPFRFQDNQPEVFGSVDGIQGTFAIDTGDSGSLLLIAPFARRYGLADRYHARIAYTGTAMGSTHGLYARAGEVLLNGPDGRPAVGVSNPITRISQQKTGFDANHYVSGNIGIGILKQFNITFDYSRRRLILEKNHLYGADDVFPRTGMTLHASKNNWSVLTVYTDGPACRAGLKPGDVIARIDGKSPAQLDADALAYLVRRPVGTILHVDIRDPNGKEHTVDLTLANVL